MNTFNIENTLAESIHVDTTKDGAELRFDGNTLGFKPSSNRRGYSITNDWNNRHFTIGFNENSVLYHLTREDLDDRESGKGNMQRGEFVAEMYGYVRSLAHPVHEDNVEFDLVGAFDLDAAREYMEEQGVIEYTNTGLTVDNTRENRLIDELEENPAKVGELLTEVLNPVPFDEIRGSGEIVFARPSYDRIELVFLYPNEYVGIVRARDLFERLVYGGGSQIIDHVLRSVTTD
ncbi:hypothetical protein [Natronorubrum sulfidifaciens]|uniref:Uncharacterized protein n=1 Tax=Natronorubrum sulfidifaciens JCM 14089 TaxID=1230460 RepID=L9WBC0_9EURY|nr:hypothetical protein [Natronorubrum sulfidifaciens]ELY46657.1 hypothetical protein C495_06103 [Natronorubrum sulfidifaciens JCM 14089]